MPIIDPTDFLHSSVAELDPITQQPVKTKDVPPTFSVPDRGYELTSPGAYQLGQYYPDEITPTLKKAPLDRIMDLPEYQAEQQSSVDKWANATGKMGITALTTFLDGTVGTVMGLQNMAQKGSGMGNFISNPFSQSMLDIQEWSEKVLPNYYTQQEQSDPWYKSLDTANFWADKVLKNFGFAIGAFAAGSATSSAFGSLNGSRALQSTLGNNIGSGLTAKILKGELKGATAEKAILGELMAGGRGMGDDLVKSLIQDAKALKGLNLTNQIVGSVGGAVGEARIEAGHTMREFSEDAANRLEEAYQSGNITAEEYEQGVQDIERKTISVGNHTFALNVAVLSAGNFAQFRNSFAGGYYQQKQMLGRMRPSLTSPLGELERAVPTTTLGKALQKAGRVGIGFKNAIIEGNEEMMQRTVSEGSKEHYKRMLDGADGGADEFINSIWGGFKDTYGKVDNWEEFVIGAFSGALGIPTISNGKVQLAGGMWADISEQRSKNKRTDAAIEQVNAFIRTPEFQARYHSANNDMHMAKIKEEALTAGDIFNWKTQDDAQFANIVNTFYNAGQLEMLIDRIEGMENVTPEELKALMQVNKAKDAEGKVVDADETAEYFKNWTDKEVSDYTKDRSAKLLKKIEQIRDIREAVDVKFGNVLGDTEKTILASQLMALKDIDYRENSIHENLTKNTTFKDGREATQLARKNTSLFTRNNTITALNNRIRGLKSVVTKLTNVNESIVPLQEEGKKLDSEIAILNDIVNKIDTTQENPEARAKAISEKSRIEKQIEKVKSNKSINDKKIKQAQSRQEATKKQSVRKQSELDALLEEEFEARQKVVETLPELYEDMTYEEYRNQVMDLSDRVDEFEEMASPQYDKNGVNPIDPDRNDKIQESLKDLFKLNSLRMSYLTNYVQSVQALQKDTEAFVKMRKEVENELADREANSMLKRILSGAEKLKKGFHVKNNTTGEEFQVRKIGDDVKVLGKNSIGSYSKKVDIKVDRDFVRNFTPASDFDAAQKVASQALQEMVDRGEAVKVDVNQSGISIADNKLVVTGALYVYKVTKKDIATDSDIVMNEKYLRAPNGKFYKIYNEGDDSTLGTQSFQEKYFEAGELTAAETKEAITVPFEGNVRTNTITGQKYLVKAEHIPELDALINKQEITEALSDEEQAQANIEAEELDNELVMDNATTETLNNPEKVLLILTRYKGKDKSGNWVKTEHEIKDTEEGRAKVKEYVAAYKDANGEDASLFGAVFESIKTRSSNPTIIIRTRDSDNQVIETKYHVSLPKNPPKKVVLVARDRKTKSGKVLWGKPIAITDSKELKDLVKDIKTSAKGSKYVIRGKKFYFVKEVDYLGDNAKYNHWRYSYNMVYSDNGVFNTTLYGKPQSVIDNFKEFLETAIEGVDYIKTSKGYKVFRKIDFNEATTTSSIQDGYRGPSMQREEDGKFSLNMFNLYGDIKDLTNVEMADTKYLATDNKGNRMGISRKQWKYPITTIDNITTIGKGSEFDWEDRKMVFVENVEYGEIPTVTEPSEHIPFDPEQKFELNANSLFVSTIAYIDPILGNTESIDNQQPKVKRFTNYLNKTNLKDGNHRIMVVSGQAVGDTDNAKSLKFVVAKKIDGVYSPVDSNGNAIEISDVFANGIFQEASLPTRYKSVESEIRKGKQAVSDTRSRKTNKEISLATDKASVDKAVARYEAWYNAMAEQVNEEGYVSKEYSIQKVTKGQNLLRSDESSMPVRDALKATIDKGNYKLHVGTRLATTLFSGEKMSLNPGYTYLEDLDTGNVYQLQTNKLNQVQQDTVIELIRTFVSNFSVREEDGKITSKGAGNYQGFNLFKDGLENYVFFQDRNNISNEGKDKLTNLLDRVSALNLDILRFINNPEVETASLARAEKEVIMSEYKAIIDGTNKAYQINSNPKTQLYFMDREGVQGGLIVIGGEKEGIVLPLLDQSQITEKILNPDVEEALREFLPNRNMNIVRTKDKLNSNEPFKTLVYEDGKLELKTINEGYNSYVLDNTTTDSVEHGDDNTTTVGKQIVIEVLDKDIPSNKDSGAKDGANALSQFTSLNISTKALTGLKNSLQKGVITAKDDADDPTANIKKDIPEVNNPPSENDFIGNPKKSVSDVINKALNENDLFSRVVRDKNGRLALENRDKFLKWVSEKLGDQFVSDFIRLENTIVEGRWGEFSNGLVKLYNDALEGTGYHEVFHAVVSKFMSNEEFSRLEEQVKKDPRFTKQLAETRLLYPALDERGIIEEVLAEAFSDYVLSDGQSLQGRKQPKLKGLFGFLQRIVDWVTGANRDFIGEMFSKIDTGFYKNATPNPVNALEGRKDSAKHKKVLRDSKQFEVDAMNTVSAIFFNKLFGNDIVPNALYELFGKQGIDSKVTDKIYAATLEHITAMRKYYESQDFDTTTKDTFLDGLGYIINNWEQEIIPHHAAYLSKFGITREVIEDDTNDDDKSGRSESGAAYNYSSLRVSAKASATRMLRVLIGGVAMKNANGTPVINNIGGQVLADFGKNFSILSNHLANTTSLEEKLPILKNLYSKVPEIQKLTEDILRLETFLENPLDFNAKEVELLMKFNQAFSKNGNRYMYSLMGADGQYKIEDANAETILGRVKTNWKANFSKSIEGRGSSKVVKKGSVSYYNPKHFKQYANSQNELTVGRPTYAFLRDAGIYAEKEAVDSVIRGESDFIGKLFRDIMKGNQAIVYSNTVDADFTGRFNEFISKALEGSLDFVENAHFNIGGSLVYNNTVNSPISIMFNKLNQISKLDKGARQEELLKQLPFLNPAFTYNQNSLILKAFLNRESGFEINMDILEGTRIEGDEGKEFKEFNNPERLFNWYHLFANGNYVLMRPSDNSIERFITMPSSIFKESPQPTFIGYLTDEMNFAADKGNYRFKNFAANRYKGILLDVLAEANDQSIYDEAKEAINKGTVTSFIQNRGNEAYAIIEAHVQDVTRATEARFAQYGITPAMLNNKYPISKFVQDHMWIAIEQTKLITGNIVLFKNLDDMYKRNSSVANTKKISTVSTKNQGIEKWIAAKMPRYDKINSLDDKHWYNNMPVLRTMIVNDVVAKARLFEEYREVLGDRVEGYDGYDETDGFSYISAHEDREFLFRSESWTTEMEDNYQYEMQKYLDAEIKKESTPELLKSFKRLFGVEHSEWTVPIDPETKQEIKFHKGIKINSTKPQYRAPMAIDGFYPTMYKTSFLRISPSLFMDMDTGKVFNPGMYELFKTMSRNEVGIVSFQSANKGATTLINTEENAYDSNPDNKLNEELSQPLYNENGILANFDDYIIQPTFYEYWGIQVDTGFTESNSTVYGTQMLAHVRNGVFSAGEAVEGKEGLGDLIKEFEGFNNDRIAKGLEILTDKLGLIFEDNKWSYNDDKGKLVKTLIKEATSRNMPDNVINAIYFLDNAQLPMDGLVNSDKMQSILYSMVDRMTLKQKAFGKASYQIPSTLFEGSEIREMVDSKGQTRIVSNNLEFYGFNRDTDGNIISVKSMQVYLPSYLKGIVNVGKVTDKRLLKLIGFRIPTQGLNSIESIEVKGFLPSTYGDVIVLPSEIVVKTGSDFDIDKMFIYIPNFYLDENNNSVYIEEEGKDYFNSVLLKAIKNVVYKGIKESKTSETSTYLDSVTKRIITEIADDTGFYELEDLIEGLEQEIANRVSAPEELYTLVSYLEQAVEEGKDVGGSNVGMNSAEYELKVIENKMLEKMQEIITHPENARQLLNPIDSDNFQKLAAKLRETNDKRNADNPSRVKAGFKNALHKYSNPLHHLQVSKQNMEGAGAIGIAANSSKFQIYAARHDYGVAPTFMNYKVKVENGSQVSDKISTKLNLLHNKRSDGSISLGGMMDANNKMYIYEAFNAYITLTVDNAKDPVLDDLNAGLKTINTALYLSMAGVPYETIHYFLNQPSIIKYLENMSVYESDVLKANSTYAKRLDLFTDEILALTLKEFGFYEEIKLDNPGNITYTLEHLTEMVETDNIHKYDKQQVALLLDFVRYQRTATEIGKASQGTQYDTKSFGRGEVDAYDLQMTTEKIIDKGVITNYNDVFENGFLKEYKKTMAQVLDRLSQFSLVMRNNLLKDMFFEIMNRYHSDKVKLGRERRLEVLHAWKKDAMTSLLLSKEFKMLASKELSPKMVTRIDELFKGPNSVPSRILRIKNIIDRGNNGEILEGAEVNFYEFFKNNKFMEQLNPEIDSEKEIHNLTLHSRRLDFTESDLVTEGWQQMMNKEGLSLAYDLVEFVLLQSGMQGSPMTMVEFIPFDVFGNIVNSVLSQEFEAKDAIRYASQFYANNYVSNDVAKKIKKSQHEKFLRMKKAKLSNASLSIESGLFPVYKVTEAKPEYKDVNPTKLMDMVRKGLKPWQSKPGLYLTATGERIPDFGNTRAFREKSSLMVYGTDAMNKWSDYNQGYFTETFTEGFMDFDKSELLEDYSQSTGQTLGTETKSTQPTTTKQTDNTSKKQDIFNIKTNNGITISSLGYTQEQWNSFSKEKQEKIKNCN